VNSAPIIDKEGTIHVLFSLHDNIAMYMKSSDEAATWSTPVNVTREIEPGRVKGSWYAPGPSGGIETRSGVLVAGVRGPFGAASQEYMAAVVSSDKGQSWSVAGSIPTAGAEEPSLTNLAPVPTAAAAAAADNISSGAGSRGAGIAALSRAGGGVFALAFSSTDGRTWDAGRLVNMTGRGLYPCDGAVTCVAPDCQGSLLGVQHSGSSSNSSNSSSSGGSGSGSRLLLGMATATDTKGRSGFRVFASDDGRGESWRLHLTLAPNDWSVGYSSMVLVANASSRRAAEAEGERGDEEDPLVACLYESRVCQSPALCPMGINFALFRG
jgi:hypothetical protein